MQKVHYDMYVCCLLSILYILAVKAMTWSDSCAIVHSKILILIAVVIYFATHSCNTILAALDGVTRLGKANSILQI
jgi:hypothetical protein